MDYFDDVQFKPIEDFIEPFKRKSSVHYGFHSYFTTQPFNVVQEYIRHFSKKNELVADPFVGSGVTAVESLRLERKTFALDLNPFAVFITKTKCSYVDLDSLYGMYEKILKTVEKDCERIENLPQKESIKLEIPFWYPKDILLPSNADVKYLHEIFTKKQLYQFSIIKNEIEKFPKSKEKDLLLIIFCGTLSRANIAYSLPDDGRSIYSGDFTIFQTGRYRIPKNIVEIPVLPVFKRRFADVIKAKKETNGIFKDYVNDKTLTLKIGSATNLKPYLDDESVDYIYTDPPYGGNIAYLDLSIIYNAWLGFEVTDIMKEQEAIEGGEIKHSKEDYMRLIRDSLIEMSRVIKHQRWLSLVFHHKEPSLWTNIVETAKTVGLEYQNSVVQSTKLPSWHKIDVPQSVLSSQMIINFLKKDKAFFSFTKDKLPLKNLILNVAEREIIKRNNASFEEIINALIPELFEHNYIHEEAQTTTNKIYNLLEEEFSYNIDDKNFVIKEDKGKKLGSYIPLQDRIKYYLISYLRKNNKATLEEIIPYLLPKVINGETPSGQEIIKELKKVAYYDGHFWVFQSDVMQPSFNFDTLAEDLNYKAIIPDISDHNKIIYQLALIGNKYGFSPKIGDQEQKEPFLKAVNQSTGLNYLNIGEKDKSQINNIDCLWLNSKDGMPIFAFEVEHSTNIRDAFERFLSLLKIADYLGYQKSLVLIVSKKNRGKFDTAIKQSSYIGSPYFLNNKISYMFESDLISHYDELLKEKDFNKFKGLLANPELG